MKFVKLTLVVALFAVAGAARAQEEVVGDQVVPAPTVKSYGVMPSWATGHEAFRAINSVERR